MGFNKRIIHRENIDNNLSNLDLIIKLTNADALIMDYWSSSFFKNLNINWKDYQFLRQTIIDDTKFSSNLSLIKEHINFNGLSYLSNIYYNLKTNPSWVDIISAQEILKFDIPVEKSGIFNELVNLSIENIDSKFKNI